MSNFEVAFQCPRVRGVTWIRRTYLVWWPKWPNVFLFLIFLIFLLFLGVEQK
jgi:hypothetical protein